MEQQPIKVRISEAFPDPNWKNDPSQFVEIYGASFEPTDNLIQYKIDVYGAAPYITSLYFNNLGDAYKAWVTLKEETTINDNVYLTEYNRDTTVEKLNMYTYDEAIDYLVTLEKFKYL